MESNTEPIRIEGKVFPGDILVVYYPKTSTYTGAIVTKVRPQSVETLGDAAFRYNGYCTLHIHESNKKELPRVVGLLRK